MNDENEIIYGLKLFNEKADKLFRLSFVKTMFETKTGVSFSGKINDVGTVEITSARRGPDEEAIDAFVLTFRFFIQDNEKSSFRNLAKYYENSQINSALKDKFNHIRNKINDFLDESTSSIVFKFNGEQLTRRKIMDTFLYGGLSHSNDKDKKNMYDIWMKIPLKDIVENEFVYTLSIILKGIGIIKEINKKVLDQQNKNWDITSQ